MAEESQAADHPANIRESVPPADEMMPSGLTIRFDDLAALPVFHEFYHLIRRLFGVDMALVSCDGQYGHILGAGRELNPFCRLIQKRPGGLARCRACDQAHVRRAMAASRPIRYMCHAGLREFLIPIEIGHGVIALLQCGQVLDRVPSSRTRAWLKRRLKWAGDISGLLRVYAQSRILSRQTQRDLMALLRLVAREVAMSQARLLMAERDSRDRIIARALAFLNQRFLERVTLSQVAAAAGASVRHLVRLFRVRRSGTVVEHLYRLRIAYACERLRQTHEKIGTIGLESGFGSIQQFNRVFRKLKGLTPTRWRKHGMTSRGRGFPAVG